MGAIKKTTVMTDSYGVDQYVSALSKAALADIVIDLVRQKEGLHLEGRPLAEAIVRSAEPVLRVREDKQPGLDAWVKTLQRNAKGTSWEQKAGEIVDAWFENS